MRTIAQTKNAIALIIILIPPTLIMAGGKKTSSLSIMRILRLQPLPLLQAALKLHRLNSLAPCLFLELLLLSRALSPLVIAASLVLPPTVSQLPLPLEPLIELPLHWERFILRMMLSSSILRSSSSLLYCPRLSCSFRLPLESRLSSDRDPPPYNCEVDWLNSCNLTLISSMRLMQILEHSVQTEPLTEQRHNQWRTWMRMHSLIVEMEFASRKSIPLLFQEW